MRFWNILGWILWLVILIPLWLGIIYYIFVWIWWCFGFAFNPIKNFIDIKKQEKEEEKEIKRKNEEQWGRVSKELKESWFSLESKEKKMTPKEKAEYEKRIAKLKKDKIIIMIAFVIVAILILFWMIVSMSE